MSNWLPLGSTAAVESLGRASTALDRDAFPCGGRFQELVVAVIRG